jgi:hypothetical protein
MIWNYDYFSRWNMQSLTKFAHFEKFILLQQLLKKERYIGATISIFKNKLQNILFKKNFIWKKWIKLK